MFRWLSALIALPTVVYAGRAVLRVRLCGAQGPPPQYGRADLARDHPGDGHEPLPDHAGSEQVYFDAAVMLLFFLLVGRYLDEALRVRARGEAQNLLSLQSGIATVIAADGSQRKVAG